MRKKAAKRVTATEAARRFADVLDAVERRGERFVVTRGGKAIASIAPVPEISGAALKEVLLRHRPDGAWADELSAARTLLTAER